MNETKLKQLLDEMSLEEKIMQLVQLPGWAYEEGAAVTGLADDAKNENMKRLAGSTLGIYGADKVKKIQDEYMKNHPHHIPLLFMLDVIHGHKTVFPCPLGQGATFDTEVARKGASIQAKEAAADGVQVTFSPMGDLVRDARWGRVVESTGEDPYLNGLMVSAMVKGYQGEDVSDPDHLASCVKHFAAYGGAVAGRDYNNVEVSEHTLREQYLPAYAEGIKAGAKLVMTSFNTLNGIPSSGNTYLMRDILRKEMQFDGVLISDWGAIAEMESWGFAEDLKDAADLAMKAGVDIDMCTEAYSGNLGKLIEEGKLSVDGLNEAVLRVLKLKNDLGLFEDPYHGASDEKFKKVVLSNESREIARDAVRKSLVLLENKKNALPLSGKRIAFIGPYANEKNLHSTWAISCDPEDAVTIADAAKECYGDSDVVFRTAQGCNMLKNGTDLGMGVYEVKKEKKENEKLLDEAIDLAEWADEIVLCLGEHIGQSGESTSRAMIDLPKPQMKLFKEMADMGKKIITLVFCGRPLDLKKIPEKSDALLICFRPGTEGGHGIMDVLSGKYSPQGKLPMSFPWCVGQEPLNYNAYNTGRPKPQQRPTIFTTRYLDCPNEARYPFGYGLTYSDFEVSKVELDKKVLGKDDKITASVTVKNTGDSVATETIQLYIRDMAGSRVRPVKELRGFKKVSLSAGETEKVSFDITEDMLCFYTINNCWDSEDGKFTVYIGTDSATLNGAEFELKKQ